VLSAAQVDKKIELAQLEVIVEKGLRSFYEAGQALLRIQQQKLYPQATYEAYLSDRWHITPQHANRLKSAFLILDELRAAFTEPMGSLPLPETERQIRPLAQLPAEQRPAAWETAVATAANAVPTAKEVQAATVAVATAEPAHRWEPEALVKVVAGPDQGTQVTVVEADAKKPLVRCTTADGKSKTYLTTQLEGHVSPTELKARPEPKQPPKEASYVESLSTTLEIESGRLALVERSAYQLVLACLELLAETDLPPENSTVKAYKAALHSTAKLLGISLI
jgi:hypothetical protein